MKTAPLLYESEGRTVFRCAWCQREEDVRTFMRVPVIVQHRTFAYVCDPHNHDAEGKQITRDCQEFFEASLHEMLARIAVPPAEAPVDDEQDVGTAPGLGTVPELGTELGAEVGEDAPPATHSELAPETEEVLEDEIDLAFETAIDPATAGEE